LLQEFQALIQTLAMIAPQEAQASTAIEAFF
jgi:hypothetical protein